MIIGKPHERLPRFLHRIDPALTLLHLACPQKIAKPLNVFLPV